MRSQRSCIWARLFKVSLESIRNSSLRGRVDTKQLVEYSVEEKDQCSLGQRSDERVSELYIELEVVYEGRHGC